MQLVIISKFITKYNQFIFRFFERPWIAVTNATKTIVMKRDSRDQRSLPAQTFEG